MCPPLYGNHYFATFGAALATGCRKNDNAKFRLLKLGSCPLQSNAPPSAAKFRVCNSVAGSIADEHEYWQANE